MKKIVLFMLIGLCLLVLPLRAGIDLLHEFKPTDGATPVYANLLQVDNYLYGMAWRGGDYNKGIIFRFQTDGSGYMILHSFAGGAADGESPYGSLIGVGGVLYGMTQAGGANSFGTVFKINPDGSDFALLHGFGGGTGDGSTPHGSLVVLDGALYGMTSGGGASYNGTVFKIGTDGSSFTLLHSFSGGTGDGQSPMGSLLASGGTLYGMTGQGGASYKGTIFKINPDGSGYSLLRHFAGGVGDGENPKGDLVESGGVFYGMTYSGGSNSVGTVFKVDPDGSDFVLLHSFAYGMADGRYPIGSLVAASGVLYGMAKEGGAGLSGVIFALNTDGSNYSLLRSFSGGTTDGKMPQGSLILSAGELFGMTQEGGTGAVGTIFKIGTGGSGYSLLHNFLGWTENGNTPYGSLIELDGVLYGMTAYGGTSSKGTVFKLNADGSGFAVLHSFAGGSNGDGESPAGSLLALDGVLYGMTRDGGALGGPGLGTVFKINPDGSGYALLHTFTGSSFGDGDNPMGSLVTWGGELYGMTQIGGTSDKGAIFKIHPDGSGYTLLYSFAGGSGDGRLPRGSLVETGGALFGMTYSGGASDYGTIFKIHPDGSGYTLLHNFAGGAADGAMPSDSLLASGGALYGMTYSGGESLGGAGTVFRIDPDGSHFSLLHVFSSSSDGGTPLGSLIESGGALYGMTFTGGAGGYGTLFKFDLNGLNGTNFAVLHNFGGGAEDGMRPEDSLIAVNGVLYGMTPLGGKMNSGIIFSYGLAQITLAISGTITDGVNPVQGVGMNGLPGTVTTDASGFYSGAVNYGWSGTVTPSLTGYTFIPVSRTYGSVTSSQAGQDFTAVESVSITVTSPNGGESWTAGTGQEITWTSSGSVGNVDIIYTYDGGSTWHSVVADTANDGSHLWTVPDTPSGNCYAQVLEHAAGTPYDASDAPFTILTVPGPSLELTTPNGWEHWTLGTTKAITWNAVNYTGTVRLVLFKNGVRFGNIVANLPASAGTYAWTVGQTYDSGMAPKGSDYRLYLRSTDNTIVDPSDYRLGLIDPAQLEMTSPNGGESWELGTTQNITWNANGYAGTVRLILFQKAAKVGQIVANLPADQGSYAWTVGTHQAGTAPAGILYAIRLLAGDGSQDDFNDGPLTLIENEALVVDHHHTTLNIIPSQWLEQAKRHKLLVLGAQGNDPVTLGLRLLGNRDARLAPVASPKEPGLVAQEGSWLPQGAALDPQEWRWSLEKAILESQATVVVIRPDEQALLTGKLDASGYLNAIAELSGRLPGVKLACVTASMDEPNDILAKFNRQVRESVLMNQGVLIDTSDIESWSGGEQQLVNEVPVRHPANRMSQGMESQGNLVNQGAATWWLLARMAGWEG